MNGIILKMKEKVDFNVDEVTNGEFGLTTDTNELVVNDLGVLKFRQVIIINSLEVFKNEGVPTDGDLGDLVLDTQIGQHKEYYKMENWKVRFEGYDQNYLENNFEPKVNPPTPDDYVNVDGTTPLNVDYDISTGNSVVTKEFVDEKFSKDFSAVIVNSGSRQMATEYAPILGGDVIDKKYLSSGKFLLIPPTQEPTSPGILWNDLGTLKISN